MFVTSKDYARLFPTQSWEAIRKRYQRMKERLEKGRGQYLSIGEIAREEGMDEAEARRIMLNKKGQ